MKCLMFLVALTVSVESLSIFDLQLSLWDEFKLTHNKKYDSQIEDQLRMKIFLNNMEKMRRHSEQYKSGNKTFDVSSNEYSDMLPIEFFKTMNGFNGKLHLKLRDDPNSPFQYLSSAFIEPMHVELPRHKDWRNHGAVTPVKNQGHCGSCWSFSTTGALEGQHFRKTGRLVSLSEQNLIDCSVKYGNDGCNGGLMDNAFQYIKDNHGIDTEKSYPYEGEDDKCRYKQGKLGATDSGFVDVPEGDERALMKAVASVGPVAVAIDASHESFMFYKKGVYSEENCSSKQLDHGVLVVGYGTDKETGMDYWLVKNSWGESWGEKGFIKMARNQNNMCGISSSASYPLV